MEQKVYPKELHGIDIKRMDRDALYVLEKLTAAGHTAYLVGGGVRDLLLKRTPKDYDISTSAEPETIRKLFRNCILIGKRFRLAHIRFGKKIIEVSTFRSGDNENDALIVRDNVWGTPEEDVLRRDFTINGLFYDPIHETVIDYVGGFEDLETRSLKTIGAAFIRFRQDPVRMLRLLKFKARFNFVITPEADTALLESKQEILKSSSARILEELLRMLESGSSTPFIRLLAEYGLLQLILPAIASFLEHEEGKNIYQFLDLLDKLPPQDPPLDRSLSLACLLFPLFMHRMDAVFGQRSHPPHLGEVQEEANTLFHEAFESFFKIPRRLKVATTSILTSQLRLTPFDKKRPRSFRIPQDPSFPLALLFLHLRAKLDPSLEEICLKWRGAYEALSPAHFAQEDEEEMRTRKRRRRRRGPRGGGSH